MHLRERTSPQPKATLLYLHGLGESCLGFEDLVLTEALMPYRHLAPDLPGYGKSPWPKEPLGLDELVDIVGRWLPTETDERVIVVGHSMGGVLGQYLCERFPGQVRGLINIEGNVSGDDCAFSGRIAGYSEADFLTGGFDEVLERVYWGGVEDRPLRSYFAAMRLCDPRTLHRCAEELFAISQREELACHMATLQVPRVYVLGNPRGTAAYSRSLLDEKGIRWHAIENAGHWVYLDQPDSFRDLFLQVLGEMIS